MTAIYWLFDVLKSFNIGEEIVLLFICALRL